MLGTLCFKTAKLVVRRAKCKSVSQPQMTGERVRRDEVTPTIAFVPQFTLKLVLHAHLPH